ncbi:hypothetical protein SAMN04488564_1011000 [Lentzea waywayandensis]|uniref:Uncharacterized protein n=1 Tax=Lentzea waywayandensis TaxID=84724 RepID=A0A1I6D3V2_9PSEU|nr:hypothetical protein [Lentzea waywayandensis]SFR00043.1 hypothetical protein SAMN04488564_1011000 [Lentzea waywayandensis]
MVFLEKRRALKEEGGESEDALPVLLAAAGLVRSTFFYNQARLGLP